MQDSAIYGFFRLFSLVVLLLMAVALLYSAYISIKYWAGIGV